jgi:hypothetical protein
MPWNKETKRRNLLLFCWLRDLDDRAPDIEKALKKHEPFRIAPGVWHLKTRAGIEAVRMAVVRVVSDFEDDRVMVVDSTSDNVSFWCGHRWPEAKELCDRHFIRSTTDHLGRPHRYEWQEDTPGTGD